MPNETLKQVVDRVKAAKTAIGNAITNKGGTVSAGDGLEDFAADIATIPSGGIEPAEPKDVNFYDYDGTCVYSYTADEFAELTEMPANPSHAGLTAQGWNWSLADAKAYVADYGELEIGQLYVTSDGKTRLYITLVDNYLSPVLQLNLSANTELDIDWGDGSPHSTFTTTTQDYVNERHTYPSDGNYVISITVVSGSFTFRAEITTTMPVLSNGLNNNNNTNRIYLAALKKVELGNSVNIWQSGFLSCTNLESITIPSGLPNINTYAFQECASLKCLVLPDNVMWANVTVRYCYSLQHIILPKTVNTILGDSFTQDIVIKNLNFSLISTFSSYACQRNYSLSHVIFSKNLSSIGALAFSYDFGLETLKFTSDTPPTINNISAWTDITSDCYVLVPLGTLDDYLNTTNMPDDSVYMYLCYAKYASGAELPTTSTDGYALTWYATKDDARAGTNPITVGNGKEIYSVGA